MGVDLIGVINFYSHTKDGSRPRLDATPTSDYVVNYIQTPTPVLIQDVRERKTDFNLDEHGFEVHEYRGNIHNVFEDHSEEQQSYYEDARNALKTRLGASRVIPFWHVIRFRGPSRPVDQCDQTHKNPVFFPHVDNDPPAARAKVLEILGKEEGERLMQKRFQIVNIWKPLGHNPIVNTPLALCDYQSIDPNSDLHSVEVLESKNTIALYLISQKMKDTQKWCYVSNMKSNEMFMIKIFDSDPNVAQFGAHSAFINENASPSDIEQCSVEIRLLVFYDK